MALPHSAPPAPAAFDGLPRDRGTILLAEDEDEVRRFALRTLRMLGYNMLEAVDGLEAVKIGQEHREPIDLLVTDRNMPGLRGPQEAEVLRHVHPEMRVLYMSANTDGVLPGRGETLHEAHALAKPFRAAELARKVKGVLEALAP